MLVPNFKFGSALETLSNKKGWLSAVKVIIIAHPNSDWWANKQNDTDKYLKYHPPTIRKYLKCQLKVFEYASQRIA